MVDVHENNQEWVCLKTLKFIVSDDEKKAKLLRFIVVKIGLLMTTQKFFFHLQCDIFSKMRDINEKHRLIVLCSVMQFVCFALNFCFCFDCTYISAPGKEGLLCNLYSYGVIELSMDWSRVALNYCSIYCISKAYHDNPNKQNRFQSKTPCKNQSLFIL